MKDKALSKLLSHRLRRRVGDSRELAAQLAPLEELAKSKKAGPADDSQIAAQETGAIIVGNGQSNLAKEVIEGEDRQGFLGLDPVVIVIVGLLLAFIAFIAWHVSRMPLPE